MPDLDRISAQVFTLLLMCGGSGLFLALCPRKWQTPLAQYATYVHECSHGFACMLTGGRFRRFVVQRSGGNCTTSGGKRSIVIIAGYTGTIVIGSILIAVSMFSPFVLRSLYVLAGCFVITLFKAGNLRTIFLAILAATGLGACGYLLREPMIGQGILVFMGTSLLWHGTIALKTLWAASTTRGTGSDAEAMSKLLGLHPILWTLFLTIVAFSASYGVFYAAAHFAARSGGP